MINISVEGSIGAGKSSFLHLLSLLEPKLTIIPEAVRKWSNVGGKNLLALNYENPRKYAFTLQMYIMKTQLEDYYQTNGKVRLFERSPHSSLIFLEMRKNTLDEVEMTVAKDWLDMITQFRPIKMEFDYIIYLRTNPQTAYNRAKARARPEDPLIALSFFEQLHEKHEQWINKEIERNPDKVKIIDAEQTWTDMAIEARRILKWIKFLPGWPLAAGAPTGHLATVGVEKEHHRRQDDQEEERPGDRGRPSRILPLKQ